MKNKKLKGFLHSIAGLFVLYHGFESFEKGKLLPAFAYIGFAIICILVAAMHKSITRRFLQADTAFYLLEALTILYSAWHYKWLNNNPAYYIFGITGIAFLVFTIMSINTGDSRSSSSKSRRKRRRHKPSSQITPDLEKSNIENKGSVY